MILLDQINGNTKANRSFWEDMNINKQCLYEQKEQNKIVKKIVVCADRRR